MTLAEQVLELHRALSAGAIDHAFGGALALAYWTSEPRGTRDIDVNLFISAANPEPGLAALPDGVDQPPGTVETIQREGQIRLWWDGTPIDLFFDYAPVHRDAARDRRLVPFEDAQIPVLGPLALAIFKAMFDRTRDWADIEEMFAEGSLDGGDLHEAVSGLVGPDDPRHARIDDAAQRAGQGPPA